MATRFVKASLSAVGAALWWLADKLWGDRVFAWLRPMIPTWMAEPVVSDWIESALSYGPFVALILLAIYFFWTGKRESRQPTTENWQDELVERAINSIPSPALRWLQTAPMGTRPQNEDIARALSNAGLIDRDFTGWTGVKPELRDPLAKKLKQASAHRRDGSG